MQQLFGFEERGAMRGRSDASISAAQKNKACRSGHASNVQIGNCESWKDIVAKNRHCIAQNCACTVADTSHYPHVIPILSTELVDIYN
jgi:hypothetical protein